MVPWILAGLICKGGDCHRWTGVWTQASQLHVQTAKRLCEHSIFKWLNSTMIITHILISQARDKENGERTGHCFYSLWINVLWDVDLKYEQLFSSRKKYLVFRCSLLFRIKVPISSFFLFCEKMPKIYFTFLVLSEGTLWLVHRRILGSSPLRYYLDS